jgi:exopolysaccharide production protein ExoF
MARYSALAAGTLLASTIWSPLDIAGGRVAISKADQPSQIYAVPFKPVVKPENAPLAIIENRSPAAADQASGVPVVPSANVSSTETMHSSELAAAEKLSIKFQGQTELTGQYRIGADGSISIPVIGRLNVIGMSPSGLEAALAERVTRYTGQKSYVTVEVATYRAIFVAGYVVRPASFPWQPGMTVLSAVALAGGLYRQVADGSGQLLGDEVELTRLRKAVARQKRNLASLARLEAEKKGAERIEVPKRLLDLVGDKDAAEVVNAEGSALISSRASFEAKKVALARATEMANRQLAGLTKQAERLKVQLATRRSYKSKIDSLQAKGIVSTTRTMDEFTRVGELEDRSTTVAVAIARVESTLASLERDRVNLEHDRRAQIDQDLIKIGREIAESDIEIESARNAYRKLTGTEPSLGMMSAEPVRRSRVNYKLVRQSVQGPITLKADQLAAVRPGDIVVVVVE